MGVPDESECFNDGDPCGAASIRSQAGLLGDRPDATTVPTGTRYFATDDGGGTLWVVSSGTWVQAAPAVAGAVPNDAVGLLPGETNRGTWDIAATYAVGDVVAVSGSVYVASAASTGLDPASNPGSWDVLDPTGRHIHLGPAATAGDFGTSVGPAATSGGGGLSVGYAATAGDFGTSVGYAATAGDFGVNIANIYTGTLDPGDPTTPTGATIATGFVDLPETADATNPAADHQRLIARTDGLYVRDETGAEVGPLGAAHAASHQDGGSDELALDGSQITSGTVAAARLGSGTASAGTVLHGDGAWQLAPAQVAAKIVNGEYCAPMSWQASTNHGMTAAGHMTAVPVVLPAGTAARLTVSCSVNAVSTWRLGIYPADPVTMLPTGQAPVVDAGTISLASGSTIYATLSQPIAAGLYWVAALVDAWTATPTVFGSAGSSTGAAPVILPQTASLNGVVVWTLHRTGVATGALPAVCPAMNPSYNAPRVTVRMT